MNNEEQKTKKESILRKPIVRSLIGIAVVFLLLGGFLFWKIEHGTVFIENSEISAPIISLSASVPGTLNALYVKEGDVVAANTPVAMVGTDIVTSEQDGLVINIAP